MLEEQYKQPGTGSLKHVDRYVVYGLLVEFIIRFFIMPLDANDSDCQPIFPYG